MDIKTKMTANLSRVDLEALLTKAMQEQFPGHVVKRVDFNVSDISDPRASNPSYSFTGADVVMEPKRTEY